MKRVIIAIVLMIMLMLPGMLVLAEEEEFGYEEILIKLQEIFDIEFAEAEEWTEFREEFVEVFEEYMIEVSEIRETLELYVGDVDEPGIGITDDEELLIKIDKLIEKVDVQTVYVIGSGVAVVAAIAALVLFNMLRKGA